MWKYNDTEDKIRVACDAVTWSVLAGAVYLTLRGAFVIATCLAAIYRLR